MDWTLCSACLTLCDPTDCSPPGSSVHGILQARTLAWVAVHVSRGSSWPRDRTRVSSVFCIGKWILYHWCHLGSPQHSIIAISARLKWKKTEGVLSWRGIKSVPLPSQEYICHRQTKTSLFRLSSDQVTISSNPHSSTLWMLPWLFFHTPSELQSPRR